MARSADHVRQQSRGSALGDYWPLISLVVVSGLAGLAIATGFGDGGMTGFMHAYMGVFLVIFALLKLFDLEGFKNGFAMYDLLARRVRAYGYVYPFIELALGLAYLSFFLPVATYAVTIVVFAFGTLGVVSALRRGLDIDCPCMGNILSVPLSTVTLTEDLAMVAMAGLLLLG
ncbi:MAG: MauE/DoxX family redox-associated membrane protein [Geminicoccaceae bacterium]